MDIFCSVISDLMYAAAVASPQASWFRAKISVTFRHKAAKGQICM